MPISIIVGGQYGSEGKGKVSQFWAKKIGASAVVRVGGPNSGHTAYNKRGEKMIFSQLPAACIDGNIPAILPAGSYINISKLMSEIEMLNGNILLHIDPNAVIIDDDTIRAEDMLMLQARIGSTLSGTGEAVAKRVMRSNVTLARDVMEIRPYISDTKDVMRSILLDSDDIVIEGTQGYGLSNLHAECYPYATGRDTTAAGFLSEAGLSPFDVNHIVMVLRTYPIRVAGNSGPLKDEITWEIVTAESGSKTPISEYTSVTKKLRRVGRFDKKLARDAIRANKPDVIFLNHVDYYDAENVGNPMLSERQVCQLAIIEKKIGRVISYVGNGPRTIIDATSRPFCYGVTCDG